MSKITYSCQKQKRGNHYVYSFGAFYDYHNYSRYVMRCDEIDPNDTYEYSEIYIWDLICKIIKSLSLPIIAMLKEREERKRYDNMVNFGEHIICNDAIFYRHPVTGREINIEE